MYSLAVFTLLNWVPRFHFIYLKQYFSIFCNFEVIIFRFRNEPTYIHIASQSIGSLADLLILIDLVGKYAIWVYVEKYFLYLFVF